MENKTQFPSGAIRDSQDGKPDFIETISHIALLRFARYMTSKKSRYGAGNFKKGIPVESYRASLLRHLNKLLSADEYISRGLPVPQELEPYEDHLSAIVFNALGWIHEEEIKFEEDRKNNS